MYALYTYLLSVCVCAYIYICGILMYYVCIHAYIHTHYTDILDTSMQYGGYFGSSAL